MSSHAEAEKPKIISPEYARQYFEDGVRRWRMPHKRMLGPGRDVDSMDFRGVRAAFKVTETLPHDTDTVGNRLPGPGDPERFKEHYDLGLTAIRNAGMMPLDERFEEGYERWAGAVVDDTIKQIAKAQNLQSPQPEA